jgi:hypothetical protein
LARLTLSRLSSCASAQHRSESIKQQQEAKPLLNDVEVCFFAGSMCAPHRVRVVHPKVPRIKNENIFSFSSTMELAWVLAVLLVLAGAGYMYMQRQEEAKKEELKLQKEKEELARKQFHAQTAKKPKSKSKKKVDVTAELKKKKTQQAVAQEAVEEHPSLLQLLKGHKYGVTAAAYSPNGRFLATASSDRSIRLYFRETLKSKNPKLHQINIEYDHATAMCFSSDGRSLVVATGSGTVKVYRTLALGSCKDLGMVFDGANMLFAFCCWQRNCGSSRRSWQTSLCRTRRMCTRCS